MTQPDEWQRRLAAAVEKTLKAREDKRQMRQDLAARRTAGLVKRHAGKLARLDAAAVVDESGTRCRYLVSEEPATCCPNERVPGAELCRPHLARAAQLARRLGIALPPENGDRPC